jgi:Major Facilitator Superfamily
MDYRGLALIIGGVGLSVFGFQQSALWGWGDPAIWFSITIGVALLIVFYAVEARTASPLINVRIFRNQAFLVENIILGIAMMAFIPVFFFTALYGQIALAEKATTSSLLILYFFLGFVVCAQIGGRMLDRGGAKRPVVLGCALAAVGFGLWASHATDLRIGAQVVYIVMAGAGMGLMLGQANTDAINRASRYSYGEATGITQTVRNYGASLGFALLGTLLITRFRSAITASLTGQGPAQVIERAVPGERDHRQRRPVDEARHHAKRAAGHGVRDAALRRRQRDVHLASPQRACHAVGGADDPLDGAEPAAVKEPAFLRHPQRDVDIGRGNHADRDFLHDAPPYESGRTRTSTSTHCPERAAATAAASADGSAGRS